MVEKQRGHHKGTVDAYYLLSYALLEEQLKRQSLAVSGCRTSAHFLSAEVLKLLPLIDLSHVAGYN